MEILDCYRTHDQLAFRVRDDYGVVVYYFFKSTINDPEIANPAIDGLIEAIKKGR